MCSTVALRIQTLGQNTFKQLPAFEDVRDVEDRATRLGLGNTVPERERERPERDRKGL